MAVIDELPPSSTSAEAPSSSGEGQTTPTTSGLTVEERIRQATQYKNDGNALFGAGDLDGALRAWHHALLYSAGINSFATLYGSRSNEDENRRAEDVTKAVWNNMAACYLRREQWDKAVLVTTKVLALEPRNLKALYRRTQAYLSLKSTQAAAQDLDVALTRSPNDPAVRKLAEQLVELVEKEQGETSEPTVQDEQTRGGNETDEVVAQDNVGNDGSTGGQTTAEEKQN